MFQRKRIKYDDSSSGNYYGLNIPNNKVEMNKNSNRVYIAMPQNLSTQYQPTYRQIDMGVTGMAAAAGLKTSDFNSAAKLLADAASTALPEFLLGQIAGVTAGAAQFLGLAGNADANAILAVSQGKVFNPYTEQLYSNMQFRNHVFTFKFFARDANESKEINNIIKYMKQGALPIYGSTGGTGFGEDNNEINNLLTKTKAARFFEVPDKFDIKFVRLDPNSGTLSDTSANLHYKIHTSVCTGIDVNYTPDGQYNAIKNVEQGVDGGKPLQVPAVTLNCRFTETQLVNQAQIQEGF